MPGASQFAVAALFAALHARTAQSSAATPMTPQGGARDASTVIGRPSGAAVQERVQNEARRSRRHDPDAALVKRIGEGDARAAEQLVDRHLSGVTALAARMLGDRGEAEDVAQEVFLRVWRHAGDWRPGEAKFSTWMRRVATNLCLDRLRRRREIVTDAPPEQIDAGPDGYDVLHAKDVAREVEAALATLPPRQRAAITLCHFEERSNIEAAEILETSVEAVESLLARARRSLRAVLSGEASNES